MIKCNILFDMNGSPMPKNEVIHKIKEFKEAYKNVSRDIIRDSRVLDEEGKVFFNCTSRLLPSFGMSRKGPFDKKHIKGNLHACWHAIGTNLLETNRFIVSRGLLRERFLLEIDEFTFKDLISKIWRITKDILPISWTEKSFGLVGASKVLFSVLPELVLPVDNVQWKKMFKTVDLGDVIRFMAQDIQRWEAKTNVHLNSLDPTGRLSTLPAVYNVVAMAARPIG